MSLGFRAVQWNRKKLVYDGILLTFVALYIGGFARIYWWLHPPKNLPDAIDIWIRRLWDLRVPHADGDLVDRPAGAAQPPLPSASV
jgi:hypothetical protein